MSDTYLPGDTRQRIQDLIKNRKITQAELAEKVGLSNSALSRYLQPQPVSPGADNEPGRWFHHPDRQIL